MRDTAELTGMVLKASPVGEHDRRLVILTRERGKITAFARGARRPGNPLMAVSRPLAFGLFRLYEGREAYNLHGAEISNFFAEISGDVAAACYASYFLEFADYYGRENMDCAEMLLLLYQSVRALLKPSLPNSLVQLIFELRAMAANGEYTPEPTQPAGEAAAYAWEYILSSPLDKLYTFVLKADAQRELKDNIEANKRRFIDRRFHSLEILQALEPAVSAAGYSPGN
ncbi:MAG: DNA repair protein RecO [Clostridiales bacterium]|nr:DNA repair protein RecO [Clostridiales bacterium]